MPSLTENEITDLLIGSTASGAATGTYCGRLGFNKLSSKKGPKGKPKFNGDAEKFYLALQDPVEELLARYTSKEEVRQVVKAQGTYHNDAVERCLAEYGSKIWNDGLSGPFVTDSDGDSYPKRLVFNDRDDRLTIRTHAYCLTLQRACQRMKTTPSHPRNNRSFLLPPDPDVDPRGTLPSPSGSGVASNRDESGVPQTARQYSVPVAQMYHHDERTHLSAETPPPQVEVNTRAEGDITDAHGRPGPYAGAVSDGIAYVPNSFPSTTSDGADLDGLDAMRRRSPQKRGRIPFGNVLGTNFKSLRRLKRKGSSGGISYPSPPIGTPDEDDLRTDENFGHTPVTSAVSTMRKDNVRGTNIVPHGLPMSPQDFLENTRTDSVNTRPEPRAHAHASEEGNDDHGDLDSVQGDLVAPHIEAETSTTTTAQDKVPELIVKLKLSCAVVEQLRQLRIDRKYLALKLPNALESGLQQNVPLEEIVKLISKLRRVDGRFLMEFGSVDSTYQRILNQWLDLVSVLIQFRKATQYHGDRLTWAAHVASLEQKAAFAAGQYRVQAGLSLDMWRKGNANLSMEVFSRDVTHIVLGMADWMRVLSIGEIEEFKGRMIKLNHGILEWFEDRG